MTTTTTTITEATKAKLAEARWHDDNNPELAGLVLGEAIARFEGAMGTALRATEEKWTHLALRMAASRRREVAEALARVRYLSGELSIEAFQAQLEAAELHHELDRAALNAR